MMLIRPSPRFPLNGQPAPLLGCGMWDVRCPVGKRRYAGQFDSNAVPCNELSGFPWSAKLCSTVESGEWRACG